MYSCWNYFGGNMWGNEWMNEWTDGWMDRWDWFLSAMYMPCALVCVYAIPFHYSKSGVYHWACRLCVLFFYYINEGKCSWNSGIKSNVDFNWINIYNSQFINPVMSSTGVIIISHKYAMICKESVLKNQLKNHILSFKDIITAQISRPNISSGFSDIKRKCQ